MVENIKKFLEENSDKLPIYFASLTICSSNTLKACEKPTKVKFISMRKYNTNRYRLRFLYKSISKY